MLRVSWSERRSNTNVARIIGGRRDLVNSLEAPEDIFRPRK